MIIVALLLLPPAPPAPPRRVPIAPFSWDCELVGPEWKRFQLAGGFGEFPPETAGGTGGTNAVVTNDSSGRFSGTHKVYPVSANAGLARGWYNMIVRRENRTYYHFNFEFYGKDLLASVTVEEQLLAKVPNTSSAAAVGFCRVKDR